MATIYSPNLVTRGIKLLLDASNSKSYPGSGSTWSDLSGNSNNCAWNAIPTFNTSGSLSYFTFNGSTHYGTITNSDSLNFSQAQTLIMVLRHTYTSGRKNPWNQAYAGYGTWTHENGSNMSGYFGDGGGDNSPYIGPGSAATPTSTWYVIGSVRDTSTYKWYMNGSLSSTTAHSYFNLATTSANILIGYGYAGYWQGDMAMVISYTTALSDEEMSQNYTALRKRLGL